MESGKIYIGSSFDLKKRLYEHGRLLRKGTHKNQHLQSGYDSAKGNFSFEVIIYANDKDYLLEMEKAAILSFKSNDREFGYNKTLETKINMLGYKHSQEFKEKIRDSKKGNSYRKGAVVPEEMRERIRAKLKGRPISEETKKKMSAVRRGVPQRPEWIAKRHAAAMRTKNAKKELA
ncbi:MAG: GIY-YIG nuclease family protein [Alphaproteobacteria bacterium]|nr:GIY-YIG nuclease family protein [Alphaproteobacteria bacterium]